MSCLLSRRSPVTCVILVSSSSGTFWPNMRLHGRPGVNPSTTPNRGSEAISCQGPAPQQRVTLSIEHHPPPSSPQPMAGVAPQVSAVAPWAAPLLAENGRGSSTSEIHMAAHRPPRALRWCPGLAKSQNSHARMGSWPASRYRAWRNLTARHAAPFGPFTAQGRPALRPRVASRPARSAGRLDVDMVSWLHAG